MFVLASVVVACGGDDTMDNNPPVGNFCGDGTAAGQEQCDDGNRTTGDGCSATCTNEIPNVPVCGDGVVNGADEACDDGNNDNDDGCSAECQGETGGGGGGGGGGATGSGTCATPYDLTLTMNMGVLEGKGAGDTTAGSDQVAAAACDESTAGAGKDHVWKFTLAASMDVFIRIGTSSSFDTSMRLLRAPCDVATEVAEYTGVDGCANGTDASETFGIVDLEAGTYYLVIDGATAGDAGTYSFELFALPTYCGDGELDALEFCDDGDRDPGDGCNAKCEVESGYTCDFSEPSVCVPATGAVAPSPGDLLINEFMAGDNASDTNCDGKITGTDDEYIELVNVSNKTLNLDGVTIADSVIVRHTFGAMTLAPGKVVVIWSAGTPMCPNVTSFDVASSGQLGLNDVGDRITMALGTTKLFEVMYPAATLNQSFNLKPDVTGAGYALHSQVTGAVGKYSPGLRANGTTF